MGAFQDKVQDMVGSTYSVTTEDELFEAAVHEIADILPTEFLLKNVTTPINITTSAGTDVKESKVLFVERGSVPADLIEYSEFLIHTGFSGSIYELETNSWPAYYVEPTGDGTAMLKVLPTPTVAASANVYIYSYPTSLDLSSDNTISNFPTRAYQAVVYKTALLILGTLIKDASVNEEDPELLAMYQQQKVSLEEAYTKELMTLGGMEEPGSAE